MIIGANYLGGGNCEFTVWAPFIKNLSVKIRAAPKTEPVVYPMERTGNGYWKRAVGGVRPGSKYYFRIDNRVERADPASHFQPGGIEKESEVMDHGAFRWGDAHWKGLKLSEFIIYEMHTGAFTPGGTLYDASLRLDDLKEFGINAVELMPVAQFPGRRNWGYDGVFLFAVQDSYGGPEGLKVFINECHKRGIAVILDVVYNHLGPEGNYLSEFGHYFTDKYKTPWGMAVNFDGPYSDEVRNFFIENAAHWFVNYHADALRLDAVHAIYDFSAKPFLAALRERVAELSISAGRDLYVIAESDLNDPKLARSSEKGGFGLDAIWSDDYHHSLHALLTEERNGYYGDFGRTEHFVKALKDGFAYSGEYSAYRKRSFGNDPRDLPYDRFVVFSQNHDQVGNRMFGERLPSLVSFEALKLAAGSVLLSPYIPLIFMGEEYGEESPFTYFVDFADRSLTEAVRVGRKEEFREFLWTGEPPDPGSSDTFLKSKLKWEKRNEGRGKILLSFYSRLIALRREVPALKTFERSSLDASGFEDDRIAVMRREGPGSSLISVFNFNYRDVTLAVSFPEGIWIKTADSASSEWGGPGSLSPDRIGSAADLTIRGQSFVLYIKKEND